MANEENDWFTQFFNAEEAANLQARSERIEEDMSTVYDITLVLPREQAIQACQQYYLMISGGNNESATEYIASMLSSLIGVIEIALLSDGIDPEDEDPV
jgi:hypothetical protein